MKWPLTTALTLADKAILAQHPSADSWLPLSAHHQDMLVLMQRETAKVIAIVDLRPWL